MPCYPIQEDIDLVRELLGITIVDLAEALGISRMTLNRWLTGSSGISKENLEAFYNFAFTQGIRLNEIHAQLFAEEMEKRDMTPMFHGSKEGIAGVLSLQASRPDNDLGPGFYCGESYAQSTMFVSRFQNSVCYFVGLQAQELSQKTFQVDKEWMLAVALFRGKLREYEKHPSLIATAKSVSSADLVIAPIADNRMFATMDSFVDGEITDVQCEHCLSATGLGRQYVLRTEKALDSVVAIEPHYICEAEKQFYLARQQEQARIGVDKSKLARRTYRNQGKYIEELFA